MQLIRTDFNENGVFGFLSNDDGSQVFYTLEHAYLKSDGSFVSKIPNGEYLCVRGIHQLKGMAHPFETFEITGIEGHTNILFHSGNLNSDSEGCVLLGFSKNEVEILNSRNAFKKFMENMVGISSFKLITSTKENLWQTQ